MNQSQVRLELVSRTPSLATDALMMQMSLGGDPSLLIFSLLSNPISNSLYLPRGLPHGEVPWGSPGGGGDQVGGKAMGTGSRKNLQMSCSLPHNPGAGTEHIEKRNNTVCYSFETSHALLKI